MKKVLLVVSLILLSFYYVAAQTVDSIKVEQAGDFIKIHYKILDSKPTQTFRVSALCSIDGGLKSQMNSLVGDFGENITGGRSDYMIIWDVLKDIEELKSAEFFIKAELVKDLSVKPEDLKGARRFFSGARLSIMPAASIPGPQYGLSIAYMGNFGISASFFSGKIPLNDKYKKNQYYTDPISSIAVGLSLSKRIVNRDKFQFHFLAGYNNHDLLVYFAGPPNPVFWRQGMASLETGIVIIFNKVVTSVKFSHIGQKQVSQHDENVDMASPFNYLNIGVGIKF